LFSLIFLAEIGVQVVSEKILGTFSILLLFQSLKEAKSRKVSEGNLALRRALNLESTKQIFFSPIMAPIKMPIGLSHIDSDLCWCDPIVEIDENGQGVVIHREVTWN
jgi:hypothetical protein